MSKYSFTLEIQPPSPVGTWFKVENDGLVGTVHIQIGAARNGRFICAAILIEGDDVSTTHLRSVPISQIMAELIDLPIVAQSIKPEPEPERKLPERAKRGGRGPTLDELTIFATTYAAVLNSARDRNRPMDATAQRLGISNGTAYRWRAQAKSEGILN